MKDLNTLNNQEVEEFFNSFDWILSDIDGVYWNFVEAIPGTNDALKSLKKIGKKVIFVTNNTVYDLNTLLTRFQKRGFEVDINDIVTPIMSIVSFLQKQHLNDKKVFAIAMDPLKEKLKESGFQLAKNAPDRVETVEEYVKQSMDESENVGAVISEVDINRNSVNLQRAVTYLKKPDVLFLTGATDLRAPLGLNKIVIGPGFYHNILEAMSGRKPVALAKPSPHLNEYIVEKYKINDSSRVLVIGDSIPEDMGFGANCGYRKLLVLSGLSKKEELEKWAYPEEFKPDFYVDSLKVIHDLILRVFEDRL